MSRKVTVMSVDSAAFLIDQSIDSVRKAIERGRIETIYTIQFGENTVTLITFIEVISNWLQGRAKFVGRRLDELEAKRLVITTDDHELMVIGGVVSHKGRQWVEG